MSLTFTAGASTDEPVEPDPAESFDAMDQEVTEGDASRTLDGAITACQRPWLELTLLDENDEPAAFADYRISAPGAGPRSGKLDEKGYVRIEGIDLDASAVTLKLWIVEEEEDKPVYEIQLVPVQPEETATDDLDQEVELPEYFNSTYDEATRDDEDADDPLAD